LLARYLNSGKAPSCSGAACQNCFMREFCPDLAQLRRYGRLPAKVGPLCRENQGSAEVFRLGSHPDIVRFAEFFIRDRFFAKGSACRRCALASRCDGMSVRAIREEGFSVLRPIPARRGARPTTRPVAGKGRG
jgi:hypothetical protein